MEQWKFAGHPESARSLGHPVLVLRDSLRRGVQLDKVERRRDPDPELFEYGKRLGYVGVHDNRRRLERIYARLVSFGLEHILRFVLMDADQCP